MMRFHGHGMTAPTGAPSPRRAATRSPARLLPHAILALAAALALLISGGGVDTADAQGPPEVLVSNFPLTDTRSTSLSDFDVAQEFTTGPNQEGYVISSIRLRLETDAAPVAPTVKLFSGSATGTEVDELSLQGNLTPSTTANYTFAPSKSVVLAHSTKYWVVVEDGDTSSRVTFGDLGKTLAAGWRMSDLGEFRTADSTGDFGPLGAGTYMIEVNGYARPLPLVLVSNIAQTSVTPFSLADRDFAQSFTTGTNPAGYLISSIELRLQTDGDPVAPTVKLFSGSARGMEVATLSLRGNLAPSTTANYAFAPSTTLNLAPGTYWVVIEDGDTSPGLTQQTGYDSTPAADWSLHLAQTRFPSTSTGDFPVGTVRLSIRINGYSTTEPAGEDGDFPGHKARGATTPGIVHVGSTSTGNLTHRLDSATRDIDSGHTGDYWLLDVEVGRRYRLELRPTGDFTPTTERGGSLQAGFANPGSTEVVPWANDDFRDDGYAFVHFYTLPRSPNHQYFAKVNSWDLRMPEDGPMAYLGGYELTLTDITGVEKVLDTTHSATGDGTAIKVQRGLSLQPRASSTDVGRRYAVGMRPAAHKVSSGIVAGSNPGGYEIDRVQFLVSGSGTSDKAPFVEVYEGGSSYPSASATPLCSTEGSSGNNFAGPHGFTANTVYAVTQLAPDCAGNILTANGTYHLVFHTRRNTSSHKLSLSPFGGPGWETSSVAGVQSGTGDWSGVTLTVDSETRTYYPRFAIWAEKVGGTSVTPTNNRATGAPQITGTHQTGQTITVATTSIADADGTADAVFTYQWFRQDPQAIAEEELISGATAETYTVTTEDEGKFIWVRVTFTDDLGNEETLTSNFLAPPGNWQRSIGRRQGVQQRDSYKQPASAAPVIITHGDAPSHEGRRTSVGILMATDEDTEQADLTWSLHGGVDIAHFTVTPGGVLDFASPKDYEAPDDANADRVYEVTVQVSDGTNSVTADVRAILLNINEAPEADAGPDQAGIAGGATVTLTGTGTDPDAGDTLSYAWTQTAGTTVTLSAPAAASTTFTAPAGLTADETLRFTLRVSDAAGLSAEDTVDVTVVASQEQEGLTATTHDLPASHDGGAFTFELRFAETPVDDFSYTTVRDHAFTVTGGSVTKARRLEPGKNLRWEVTVTPSGNGDVVLSAPATTDCAADGAICTAGGDKFSGLAAFTVGGPAASLPDAPTGLTATVNGDGSITLTWDDPGDSTITGYQILRRLPGQGETTLTVYVADTGSAATTYKDTGVTAGTRHVYRIKAINSAGVGPRSSYVNVDP